MSLSSFCTNCNGILNDIDLNTGLMFCTKCNKSHPLPDNNRTIMLYKGNSGGQTRELTEIDYTRLFDLPTTYKIQRECANCKFNIMASICDANYKFAFVCMKCHTCYK